MDVKIGDLVYHLFTDGDKGILKVVGTTEIPYKHSIMGDIYPIEGNDVLLVPIKIDKFEPFIHARKEHLQKAEN